MHEWPMTLLKYADVPFCLFGMAGDWQERALSASAGEDGVLKSAAFVSGSLVVLGGLVRNSSVMSISGAVWRSYDAGLTFQQMSPFPVPIAGAATEVLDGFRLVVMGGLSSAAKASVWESSNLAGVFLSPSCSLA